MQEGGLAAITDAHENNLKYINISIPKGKLVIFAGVSGSGKSSLICHEFVKHFPK